MLLFLFVNYTNQTIDRKNKDLNTIIDSIDKKGNWVCMSHPYANDGDEIQAIEKGDTNAYFRLSMDNWDYPSDSFLYIAKIMANKYGYSLAYYDVYCCLTDVYHKKENTELDDLDKKMRSLALNYLIKGAKKDGIECMQKLALLLKEGKYIPKDEIRAKNLSEKASRIFKKRISKTKIDEIRAKGPLEKADSIRLKELYKVYCPDSAEILFR